ncbi:hypothetical protein DY000_02019847 [Brassica cretica]|uniref:Uncharacterized protein n=1 Tax=Brassica cretica TaxID=69181 RepID=A0ABQ7CT30_BRACR|nr:hypothetical protein DY000_02019847 [Brassica cretica]
MEETNYAEMNLSHQARFYVFQIKVGVRRAELEGRVNAPPKSELAVERYLDRLRSKQSTEDDVVEERIDGIKHELLTRTVLVRESGNDIDSPSKDGEMRLSFLV